ncbi:beta-ketoacyl synthase chain length factor [Methylocaldum sp.]|uniref:beta-ketoacyl synthase chain length factor n=1 Tax=Methylocaldum sp. TaxID=1969727 RepID=UPI002D3C41F1|nr:beta-ketoacyl synthase chain length factor [Methylocaldum sp.]HYE37031.1 beta-ketoacyl synthase chain length factor [Methylocaldum sp.]
MIRVFIDGIGIIGPGLPSWNESHEILAGRQPYAGGELPRLNANRLPAAERRRSTAVTRLAIDVAEQALPPDVSAGDVATVFTSSGGEVEIIHRIFEELATAERLISPTQFHNSVHNAASGYWSIATGSRQASTSLSCFDDSFAMGLLETASQAFVEHTRALLVAYDFPPLQPIFRARPLLAPFAVSLLLAPEQSEHSLAELTIGFDPADIGDPGRMEDAGLEALRAGNPAARSLPLLAALARSKPAKLIFGCAVNGQLQARLTPCP